MFLNANFTLVAIVAGIVVIGVLIFVHELGHFLAAKSVGIAVLRFSFGLGPRTPLGIRIGETDYCLSWIPFGGFVKMAGIEEFEEGAAGALEGGLAAEGRAIPPERTFDAKPLWARIVVIVAGVTMNALFAVLVYAVLAGTYGTPVDTVTTVGAVDTTALPAGAAALKTLRPGDRIVRVNGDTVTSWHDVQRAVLLAPGARIRIEVAGRAEPVVIDVPHEESPARAKVADALTPLQPAVIGEILPGKPAEAGGLRSRDSVVAAGGEPILSWDSLVHVIQSSPGRVLTLVVDRGGRRVTLTVVPSPTPVRDPATGAERTVGKIGAGPFVPVRRFGVVGAVGQGVRQTVQTAGLILYTLKGLVTGQISARDVGGPILVGQMAGEMARLGLANFLAFIALFSVDLAILNLLPIPVLDGGHLVFLLIEGVRGRPLSLEQRQRWTQIGFFVLVGIMALALANDVLRLFH
jgi:regulator of sigma E protease